MTKRYLKSINALANRIKDMFPIVYRTKMAAGELRDDPGVIFSGILYIAMNLFHTILHCQTPSLCLFLVLLW